MAEWGLNRIIRGWIFDFAKDVFTYINCSEYTSLYSLLFLSEKAPLSHKNLNNEDYSCAC